MEIYMEKYSLKVEAVFSPHAVLQRNKSYTLRGKSEPETKVSATLLDAEGVGRAFATTCSDKRGYWAIGFPAMTAGGPFVFQVVSGKEQLLIEDIYFGDVWVMAGQSNMQLPMERVKYQYPEEYAKGTSSIIRQFCVPIEYDFSCERDYMEGGEWIEGNSKNIPRFSAVGFFFAETLYKKYQVPVGLILTAVGGTPVKAWMSKQALDSFPEELEELRLCADKRHVEEVLETDTIREQMWWRELDEKDQGLKKDLSTQMWQPIDVRQSWDNLEELREPGSIWLRTKVHIPSRLVGKKCRLSLGTITDADQTYVNGKKIGETTYKYPPREYWLDNIAEELEITVRVIAIHECGGFTRGKKHELIWEDGTRQPIPDIWEYVRGCRMKPLQEKTFFERKPAGMYQAMFAPLHHLAIRGICWYQGETDAYEELRYPMFFYNMIKDWRQKWREKLPVLFVQLPNYTLNDSANWIRFRNMQRELLYIQNTAMVVTIDLGEDNDLHPVRKKPVGERLAMAAFQEVYKEKGCWESPVIKFVQRENNSLRLYFDYTGEMLQIKGESLVPLGFELLFSDGSCFCAEDIASIAIDGTTILIWNVKKSRITEIRYAWNNSPAMANICNDKGLPLSPFCLPIKYL